jgi:hypothetical protein
LPSQNSAEVPQNPNFEQQTLSGQFVACDHSSPQPGSHSDLALHSLVQFPGAQKVGPMPQTPVPVVGSLNGMSVTRLNARGREETNRGPQQPSVHGLVREQL